MTLTAQSTLTREQERQVDTLHAAIVTARAGAHHGLIQYRNDSKERWGEDHEQLKWRALTRAVTT